MRGSRVPIAFALTSFDRGGTERQTTELISRLDRRRYAIHVVCFRAEGPWLARVQEAAESVQEFRLGSLGSFRAARTFVRLTLWLRQQRIAVLQACDLYANIVALPAATLAGVPVRIGSRRGVVSPVETPGLPMLQRLAFMLARCIVANSEAAARRLAEEGVPAGRILVIPNGVDASTAVAPGRRFSRRVVTTVANLRRGKGHDVLLRAAAEVVRERPDVVFQLVGDGPLRADLERLAIGLGISASVRFLGYRDDVGSLLRATDVFAFPSLMEAFPNAVMEAMAGGVPVVATAVGGIPELVHHDRSGLLVRAGDAHALASAILTLLDRPDRADALAATARAAVRARYSFERMTASFDALYHDELQRTRRRVRAAHAAAPAE